MATTTSRLAAKDLLPRWVQLQAHGVGEAGRPGDKPTADRPEYRLPRCRKRPHVAVSSSCHRTWCGSLQDSSELRVVGAHGRAYAAPASRYPRTWATSMDVYALVTRQRDHEPIPHRFAPGTRGILQNSAEFCATYFGAVFGLCSKSYSRPVQQPIHEIVDCEIDSEPAREQLAKGCTKYE